MQDKLVATITKLLPNFTGMYGEIAASCGNDLLYHESFSYADASWIVDKNSQYLI